MKRFFYPLLFLAFGAYLLGVEIPEFLRETADMTPFYTTDVFMSGMLGRPGGLIAFTASFLQSCFFVPWLGATLLLLLLVALALSLKAFFHVAERFEGLCWLPSLALLLNFTQLGYMIYLVKSPAVAFSLPVGILVAVGLAKVYGVLGKLRHPVDIILRIVWMMATATVGYGLFGCYAVFALLLSLIVPAGSSDSSLSVHSRTTSSGRFAAFWTSTKFLKIMLVVCCFAPFLIYCLDMLQIRRSDIYLVGLPDYQWTDGEKALWRPVIFSLVWTVLLALPFFRSKGREAGSVKGSGNRKHLIAYLFSLVAFLGMGYAVYSVTFRDVNYKSILRMKHAADEGEWERVLDGLSSVSASGESSGWGNGAPLLTDGNGEVAPTRLQVLLTRLALYKLGRTGNATFRYPDGDSPYNAPRIHQYLRLVGGRLLYYYYGKPNYSYRWCMEDMVEYGMRPDYLKYMLRCSLINGEERLARKYADLLRSNPFCADFVERYYDHPAEAVKRELDGVRKLMNYEDVLDGDGGLIEVYLLNSYALMEGGSKEMTELSLISCLILKDIDGFWRNFFRLLPVFAESGIPVHYQEAALLFSRLKPGIDIGGLPISGEVSERFERLVKASEENAGMSDDYNRSALRPAFGQTYWYYYFFMNGLKTN